MLALYIDSLAESVVQKVCVEVVPPRDEPDADAEEGEAEDEEEGADDDRAGPVAALEAARVHHRHSRYLLYEDKSSSIIYVRLRIHSK